MDRDFMVQFILKDRVSSFHSQDAALDKKGREEAEEFEVLKAKERCRVAEASEERRRENEADCESPKVTVRRRILPVQRPLGDPV